MDCLKVRNLLFLVNSICYRLLFDFLLYLVHIFLIVFCVVCDLVAVTLYFLYFDLVAIQLVLKCYHLLVNSMKF